MGNSTKTKRRSEVGSVRRLSSGRWLARVTHGTRVDGSRDARSRTFGTEGEAWDWVRAESVRLGTARGVAGLTLAGLWGVYERNRLPELAKTTQSSYRQRIGRALDALGETDVAEITHGDIQRLLDGMRPSVAQKTSTVLSAVLTYGVRNGLVSANVMLSAPFEYKRISPYAAPDSDVWDTDPFAAIGDRRDVWDMRTALACMERMRGLPLEPVFLACVGAGLRVEEAFALRRMDVRRIVGSFDEYGGELWVTQLAVHHATPRGVARVHRHIPPRSPAAEDSSTRATTPTALMADRLPRAAGSRCGHDPVACRSHADVPWPDAFAKRGPRGFLSLPRLDYERASPRATKKRPQIVRDWPGRAPLERAECGQGTASPITCVTSWTRREGPPRPRFFR